MIFSGFRLFDRGDPADPLVSGERGEVVPCLDYCCRSAERLSQIFWDAVDYAGSKFFCHIFLIKTHPQQIPAESKEKQGFYRLLAFEFLCLFANKFREANLQDAFDKC